MANMHLDQAGFWTNEYFIVGHTTQWKSNWPAKRLVSCGWL